MNKADVLKIISDAEICIVCEPGTCVECDNLRTMRDLAVSRLELCESDKNYNKHNTVGQEIALIWRALRKIEEMLSAKKGPTPGNAGSDWNAAIDASIRALQALKR